jgi:hypothetical protein
MNNRGFNVSGFYRGYMDMTYFALFPPSLKTRNLKIAVVFNYDASDSRYGSRHATRRVQRQYWELLKESP